MVFSRTVTLILLFACLSAGASAGSWEQDRQRQRAARAALREQADQARAERADSARGVVVELLEFAEAQSIGGVQEDFWPLLAGLRRLKVDGLDTLVSRVRHLPEDGNPPRSWSLRLAAARRQLTAEPMDLLRRASAVEAVSIARDAMQEVLYFDPNHEAIRDALGQVRLKDDIAQKLGLLTADLPEPTAGRPYPELDAVDPSAQWFSPFEARMLTRGLVWSDERGWVFPRFAERYEQGYIYDFQQEQWRPLAEANADHARPGHDWEIRTEHLDIRGTAPLHVLARCATQLERLYDEIFAVYAAFFAGSSRHDLMRLALGLAEHDPLKTRIFLDRQQYLDAIPGMDWSAGLFRSGTGTSYFYGEPTRVMYHEFTHQVLHQFTGKNESPSWLSEAIAEYTETVQFTPDGVRFKGAPFYPHMTLRDLLELRTGGAWDQHQRATNRGEAASSYAAAGSLATFCMQAEEGRFAADFIDYLRDTYRGQDRGRPVWAYLGLSEAEFQQRYAAWGANQR